MKKNQVRAEFFISYNTRNYRLLNIFFYFSMTLNLINYSDVNIN